MIDIQLENEAEIIEKAKKDVRSFMLLYEHYLPRIYKYAYYQVIDKQEAEDVVSQTFLQAMENLHKYTYRGIPFGHWLYRIASSIIYHGQRDRKNEFSTADPVQLAGGEIVAEDRLDLLLLLRTLPGMQREVLTLRYIQDLSIRDTARIMACSEGSVKQLCYRAIKTLRERMNGNEEDR
ncbi:MAG: sigma-70 family RNA polymerase sigma factor [Desulfotomaculaceae bacterium]|nr:sigma-70 family RNA polymerase sigma factor [Desulfotomaculaceae bacterium]